MTAQASEAPARATILVVDDENLVRWSLRKRLEATGYQVLEAEDGATALAQFRENPDLVLLDFRLPDVDGLTLMRQMRAGDPDPIFILMTAYSTVASAVEVMKEGAYHYVDKPFRLDEMLPIVEKALETTRLRREVRRLRASQSAPFALDRIVGQSPLMQDLRELLRKIAQSPASTVLFIGESGTGKDLAAKSIHYNSARSGGPFMNITCSALSESLLESELFGHEAGAFTDAKQRKKGLLELAHGGTVFLDEVGEMSPGLQAKLLRFLEDRTFKRVGGTTDIRPDVRVIAATHRDLEEAVASRQFRSDLYYRLMVVPLRMPPLRERPGDVEILAKYYIDGFNREFGGAVRGLSDEALRLLETHYWPGNVRELRNACERAVLLNSRGILPAEAFGSLLPQPRGEHAFRLPPGGLVFEELEKDLLVQALERTGGNQSRAAVLLGMNRDQIRYRIEKFNLGGMGIRRRTPRPGPKPGA
ncbi:MAG: sigma-54-dependent Fis family transcriptional regulator [Deltaproteobacteria bacterium]|nr:sigma-54-dependent Fis family transcriptional regulator [Deltaproteobacteria bacterium]